MASQPVKRTLEINHALSGVFGEQAKTTGFKINDTRKQILKRLQRKKKLSSIIHDELYQYIQKFPQQRLGLHQQSFKKKKAKLSQFQERIIHKTPCIYFPENKSILSQTNVLMNNFSKFFQYPIEFKQQIEDDYSSSM